MPSAGKVLVALSGGVDSSVAAALLLEQGHCVVAATMRFLSRDALSCALSDDPREEAERSAAAVCRRLGIPHHVVDLQTGFEQHVVVPFIQEYLAARTPNPCALCNPRIKFGDLFEWGRARGATHFATGHYAQAGQYKGRSGVRRGVDPGKDQSYVLSGLSQDQLRHTLFPLGGLSKDAVRAEARRRNLPVAERPESQDICFIPDGDYRSFLEHRGYVSEPGPILSLDGAELGRHRGLSRYTVGQRKGLGISSPQPYYVVRIDAACNAIIVAHKEDTLCTGLTAGRANWVSWPPQPEPFECLAQVRYTHEPVPARVQPLGEGFTLSFIEPERGIAPGQWAVLYDGDWVIAGGIIDTFRLVAEHTSSSPPPKREGNPCERRSWP